MTRMFLAIGVIALLMASTAKAGSTKTVYALPGEVHWVPDTAKGVPPGSFYAVLRGKESDRCGQLELDRFPNGFVYPWHVNHLYALYTILKGTLVVGFNAHHLRSAERALPAGSIMQGLATEPHYGRAVGETIFEVYAPCS